MTPLEELMEAVGPDSVDFDSASPLVNALWWRGAYGYHPRSTAEIALLLPEACPQVTLRHAKLPPGELHEEYGNEWWIVWFPCHSAEHTHQGGEKDSCLKGVASDWLEALAKAVLLRTAMFAAAKQVAEGRP